MPPQQLSSGQVASVSMVRLMSAMALSTMSLTKIGIHANKQEHAYGNHAAERLDHLIPDGDAKPQAVVYFHGGGWVAGDKRYYTKDLQFLTKAGFAVFNVEYPLAPEYPHPHALRSVLRAVTWIRRNHPDVQSLHMMGDSAGANLAAMYAVLVCNPGLLAHLDPDVSVDDLLPATSLVSLYGLLDRETCLGENPAEAPGIVRLFLQSYGGAEALRLESPTPDRAITPMDLNWSHHPRCFIGVGDKDFLFASSERYAEHLAALKIPVERKIYPGAPHGFINMRHAQTPHLKNDVLQFLAGAQQAMPENR